MFEFVQTGPTAGDETAPYDVILDKTYTVQEFINTVITKLSGEWGYIGVKNPKDPFFGEPHCEYKWGKLLSSMPDDILTKTIRSAKASGGWSRMDYILVLDD